MFIARNVNRILTLLLHPKVVFNSAFGFGIIYCMVKAGAYGSFHHLFWGQVLLTVYGLILCVMGEKVA